MNDGLLIGGKYRLRTPIGAGGMGQVWVARNEITERDFAIKLLLPQAASSPQVVTRFIQEAKVSGRLRHPGILEIYDVGTATELGGAPFLVMELLHGVPLDAAIRSHRGLPLRFTLLVAVAVAKALRAAHDKGVVHRDLKPANVFLHRDEAGTVVPKLLDFGISKLEPREGTSEEALGLTQSGVLLGSPRFMSPEQVASQKDIDGRSDVHALGVLLWWCLAARSPFAATTFNTLMYEILSDARPRLADVKPDVPPGVSELVSRAFARKREERFQSAGELLAALEQELAALGPGPTLESKEWMDELLAQVTLPPPAAPALPAQSAVKDTTTHGAVSVSLGPEVERPSPGEVSPAASTSDGRSLSFGATPAGRGRSSLARSVAAGAIVGVLALGVGAYVSSRTGAPAASSSPAASSPAASTASAAALASALASPSPPLPVPAPETSAAPDAGPALESHAAAPPPSSIHPRMDRPPARSTPARPARGADDPFRGVTGTGL